jgi:hypothetical protein
VPETACTADADCSKQTAGDTCGGHAGARQLTLTVTGGPGAFGGSGACRYEYYVTEHHPGTCSLPKAADGEATDTKAACAAAGGSWHALERNVSGTVESVVRRSARLHRWVAAPGVAWKPVAAPAGARGGNAGVFYFAAACPGTPTVVDPRSIEQSAFAWNARAAGGGGIAPRQLLVGLATYGQGFRLGGSSAGTTLATAGNAVGAVPARYLGNADAPGRVALYELATSAPNGWAAATAQHALDRGTATMVGTSGRDLVSYDNWVTLATKAAWVRDAFLGGVVLKALALDDPNNGSPHHWAAVLP